MASLRIKGSWAISDLSSDRSNSLRSSPEASAGYWDALSELYQRENNISTSAFHYGPLLGSDEVYGLLPEPLEGKRCLELGAGAGQNSIVLAARGADCVAIDISSRQLEVGQALAADIGVEVEFRVESMESFSGAGFDLIHSTYALPFSAAPADVVQRAADALRPGGSLLVTTGHPLYANEWLEIADGETGVFIDDYWSPLPDYRLINDGEQQAVSKAVPLSELVGWFTGAGLVVDALLEPKPLPLDQVREHSPYWSEGWLENHAELSKIPLVVIVRGRKLLELPE